MDLQEINCSSSEGAVVLEIVDTKRVFMKK